MLLDSCLPIAMVAMVIMVSSVGYGDTSASQCLCCVSSCDIMRCFKKKKSTMNDSLNDYGGEKSALPKRLRHADTPQNHSLVPETPFLDEISWHIRIEWYHAAIRADRKLPRTEIAGRIETNKQAKANTYQSCADEIQTKSQDHHRVIIHWI